MAQAVTKEQSPGTSTTAFEKTAEVVRLPEPEPSLQEKVSLFYGAASPVIFICEDMAPRCKYSIESMMQSRQGLTIVFENKATRDTIMDGPFSPHISPQTLDLKSSDIIRTAGLIVLFGSPKSKPQAFAHKKIITVDSFFDLYPPALHKLRGIEHTPYTAEEISKDDMNDPAKVAKAESFTRQRREAVTALKKALGPTYGFK